MSTQPLIDGKASNSQDLVSTVVNSMDLSIFQNKTAKDEADVLQHALSEVIASEYGDATDIGAKKAKTTPAQILNRVFQKSGINKQNEVETTEQVQNNANAALAEVLAAIVELQVTLGEIQTGSIQNQASIGIVTAKATHEKSLQTIQDINENAQKQKKRGFFKKLIQAFTYVAAATAVVAAGVFGGPGAAVALTLVFAITLSPLQNQIAELPVAAKIGVMVAITVAAAVVSGGVAVAAEAASTTAAAGASSLSAAASSFMENFSSAAVRQILAGTLTSTMAVSGITAGTSMFVSTGLSSDFWDAVLKNNEKIADILASITDLIAVIAGAGATYSVASVESSIGANLGTAQKLLTGAQVTESLAQSSISAADAVTLFNIAKITKEQGVSQSIINLMRDTNTLVMQMMQNTSDVAKRDNKSISQQMRGFLETLALPWEAAAAV